MNKAIVFDFGQNWLNYSEKALSDDKVRQASADFDKLFDGIDLVGRQMVDIGFGQGLGLLIAQSKQANVVGCDINPTCYAALEQSQKHFPDSTKIPVVIGSILDKDTLAQLKQQAPEGYDIVHSWGVLHHTGNMWQAISNATSLVKNDGYFILAIYNKHWTSPIWTVIKWIYNKAPVALQKGMIKFFTFLFKKAGFSESTATRGMDYTFDVIDWVGGYPYEYASKKEIQDVLQSKGFSLKHYFPTKGNTGCNEFVFKKNK